MAYDRKISRKAPGLIVAVIDDSESMQDCLPGTTDARFRWVELDFGYILKELLKRSSEVTASGVEIKSRYFVLVIIYGTTTRVWQGGMHDIQSVVERFTQNQNSLSLGGKCGATNAAEAMQMAADFLRNAVADPRFRDSFPPMVFHLTDGESQTDASAAVHEIMQMQTADGPVLVVNALIGTDTNLAYQSPTDFPGYVDAAEAGPHADTLRLFNMSSVAPDTIRQNLIDDGIFPAIRPGSRLFFDVRTREMLKNVIQSVSSVGARPSAAKR